MALGGACRLKGTRSPATGAIQFSRSAEWYVRNPRNRGVCPACLDEDAAKGGDHYCRRSWAHVEAVACFKHGAALQSACQSCFRSGLFQFRLLSEADVLGRRRRTSILSRGPNSPSGRFRICRAAAIRSSNNVGRGTRR
ncbi:TniQ family protein [Rhizobium leucaenae]|uniref:TniQ family protein n=1 Tax=Rhizobiaceae TaxID=82115 RepID=UPI0012EA4B3F